MAADSILERLEPEHREALEWFAKRKGLEVPWPDQLPSGLYLVNRAKGIHKPAGWRYALSIRETLGGQYDDKEPQKFPDGSWIYDYFQEGEDPRLRDEEFTNRALMTCMEDGVCVGVLRQTQAKPEARYQVWGLAFVRDWQDGWFRLEGLPEALPPDAEYPTAAKGAPGSFDPRSVEDGRRRILSTVTQRRGQAEFRWKLLEAYGGQCAITGCQVLEVLEAAHIVPYQGEDTNHPANGLLLRADIHTLFDLGLISVDTTYQVIVSPQIVDEIYRGLADTEIRIPEDPDSQPSIEALRWHLTNLGPMS